MSEDRIRQLRQGYADDDYQGGEPLDLGPLRALAHREELAEAVGRLADSYGRPLPASDPLAPLAREVARTLTEAGFTLHHCVQHHPLYRLGGVCLLPSPAAMTPAAEAVSWCPGLLTTCCRWIGIGGRSITAHTRS